MKLQENKSKAWRRSAPRLSAGRRRLETLGEGGDGLGVDHGFIPALDCVELGSPSFQRWPAFQP